VATASSFALDDAEYMIFTSLLSEHVFVKL
jgi:hypothetical protein